MLVTVEVGLNWLELLEQAKGAQHQGHPLPVHCQLGIALGTVSAATAEMKGKGRKNDWHLNLENGSSKMQKEVIKVIRDGTVSFSLNSFCD